MGIVDQFRSLKREYQKATMICDKCHAGQMIEYERTIGSGDKKTTILGRKCERCGYIQLDSDDDIWSVVGL